MERNVAHCLRQTHDLRMNRGDNPAKFLDSRHGVGLGRARFLPPGLRADRSPGPALFQLQDRRAGAHDQRDRAGAMHRTKLRRCAGRE